jgi:hypothetical protein
MPAEPKCGAHWLDGDDALGPVLGDLLRDRSAGRAGASHFGGVMSKCAIRG